MAFVKDVALLAEGVDRNLWSPHNGGTNGGVALLAEGVDRNISMSLAVSSGNTSPSSRRAWIEIFIRCRFFCRTWSPSSRRAWIEIRVFLDGLGTTCVALLAEGVDRNHPCAPVFSFAQSSPSSRRAWIEILREPVQERGCAVALLAEGVDRNLAVAVCF